MELYGFMEREKKIPSYFFIITKLLKVDLNDLVRFEAVPDPVIKE